jgi:hypothetical protein
MLNFFSEVHLDHIESDVCARMFLLDERSRSEWRQVALNVHEKPAPSPFDSRRCTALQDCC